MKKFTFTGHVKDDTSTKYHLTVPRAKHFELKLIVNGEQDLQIQKLVTDAVRRGRELYSKHKIPNVGIRQKDNPNPNYIIVHNTHVPRTLQNILLRSEYPLSQGPEIPQLDCATEDKNLKKKSWCPKLYSHMKNHRSASPGILSKVGYLHGREMVMRSITLNLTFKVQLVL